MKEMFDPDPIETEWEIGEEDWKKKQSLQNQRGSMKKGGEIGEVARKKTETLEKLFAGEGGDWKDRERR